MVGRVDRSLPVTAITPKHLMILPDEVAVLAGFNSICRYRLDDMQSVRKPLEVEFGAGVHPTRAIESWLSDAKRFGEANLFNIALKCCQQAIASANALLQSAPGIAIRLPLGVTARQQLENAEVEYLRWTVAQESLTQPQISHERWNDRVNFRGVSELTARLGSQWEEPLADLVEAINNEHYSSEDHHHQIGRIRDFFWKVPVTSLRSSIVDCSDQTSWQQKFRRKPCVRWAMSSNKQLYHRT